MSTNINDLRKVQSIIVWIIKSKRPNLGPVYYRDWYIVKFNKSKSKSSSLWWYSCEKISKIFSGSRSNSLWMFAKANDWEWLFVVVSFPSLYGSTTNITTWLHILCCVYFHFHRIILEVWLAVFKKTACLWAFFCLIKREIYTRNIFVNCVKTCFTTWKSMQFVKNMQKYVKYAQSWSSSLKLFSILISVICAVQNTMERDSFFFFTKDICVCL